MNPSLLRKIIAQELTEEVRLPSFITIGINLGLKDLLRESRLPEIKPRPASDENFCTVQAYSSAFSVLENHSSDKLRYLLHSGYLSGLLFTYEDLDPDIDYRESRKVREDLRHFFSELTYNEIFRALKDPDGDSLKQLNLIISCCILDADSRAFIFEPFVRADVPESNFFKKLVQDRESERFLSHLLDYCEEELDIYEDEDCQPEENSQRENNLNLLCDRLEFLNRRQPKIIA